MKFAVVLALFASSTAFAIGHDIGNGRPWDDCDPDGSRQWISYEIQAIDSLILSGGRMSEEMVLRREYLIFVKQEHRAKPAPKKAASPSDDDCRFREHASFQEWLERVQAERQTEI